MILHALATTPFNPANKAHRIAVAAFLKRNAWVDSPLRFAHDPAYGSIADQVKAKMLTWYMAQESAKVAKPVVKRTATVDQWRAAGDAKYNTPRAMLTKVS